ncbi:MAG: hypothetical protein FWC98_05610 [Bacteroidales bacterium]|nr:hypothetical protein [Bacteroidales bacterium]
MKKILLILAISTIIGITIWYFVRQNRKSTGSDSGSSAGTDDFPLRRGSRGNNVMRLQTFLNERIAYANNLFHGVSTPRVFLIVDGIFGPLTEAEVRRFFTVNEVSRELFTSNNM